jgi:DNA-binding transcriptional ArsR family regulator
MAFFDTISRLFKTLMHPARLAILDELRDGEQCVCHLEAALGYRQAYISQQLMILRESGLVRDIRDGWNIFYQVALPQVFELIDAANDVLSQNDSNPIYYTRTRNPRPGCPCPKCNPSTEKCCQTSQEVLSELGK